MDFPGIFVDSRYTRGKACRGFGPEPRKFDLIKDPAFPKEGRDADRCFDSTTLTVTDDWGC